MNSMIRPWVKAAAATVGVCALALGGVGLPAYAEEPAIEIEVQAPETEVEAPEAEAQAPEAVSLSAGDKYELAAARVKSSVSELKAAEAAGAIKISEGGHVLIIDEAHDFEDVPSLASKSKSRVAANAAVPGTATAGSLPGAPVTIYLNFGGETVTGTSWNKEQGDASLTFVAAAAGNTAFQNEVWASVAEDYAPFNINVTTTRPSDDKLYKTSASDNEYGVNVVITDSYTDVLDAAAGSGGVAYVDALGAKYLSPAFVFTQGMAALPADAPAKSVAEAASHEAGHNFGLSHDGIGTDTYFNATGGIWGPIMGASYVAPLSQWSNGDYAGATNTQDDVAIITDRGAARSLTNWVLIHSDGTPYPGPVCSYNGSNVANRKITDTFQVPGAGNFCDGTGALVTFQLFFTDRADYRADTVGNTTAAASALDNSTGSFTASNVIIKRSDVDVYSFTTDGGAFSAAVAVANIAPNLDSKLTLSDASGIFIEANAPGASVAGNGSVAGLNASITRTLDAGTYFLSVEGVGFGDNQAVTPDEANGYSDYGSLGNYTLSGTAAPFVVDPIVITSPADGDSVTAGSNTVSGTSEPGAAVTVTIGGASFGPVTADGAGAWTTTVTTVPGNNVIVASQNVGGTAVSVTDTVTVTAPVAAPAITAPSNGDLLERVTFTGTGIAGAVVTVTYTEDGGATQTGTATVGVDGKWTFTPGVALPVGDYTATATQTINGVTSVVSNTVEFSTTASSGGNAGGGADGGGTAGGSGTGTDGVGSGGLQNTGSDNSLFVFGFGAIALLLICGGLTVVAARQRKLAIEG